MANIPDDIILAEAIRLVESGVSVTFPVNGRSMRPFVEGGRESLVLEKPVRVAVGQVVLAFVEGERYVIHRILRRSGDRLTLMGDGNLSLCEYCSVSDVKAVATYVVSPSGRKRPLYSMYRRFASRLWVALRPFRRYLLKIYSIIHGS